MCRPAGLLGLVCTRPKRLPAFPLKQTPDPPNLPLIRAIIRPQIPPRREAVFMRLVLHRSLLEAESESARPASVCELVIVRADAIMGVNFFGDVAPDDFGSYDLAFVTVFSMTAGTSWVGPPCATLQR